MKIHSDEIEVIFVSGLGIILGNVAINKKDVPYLHEFIQKTEFTDCFICKGKEKLLLSRVKLKEVLKFIK